MNRLLAQTDARNTDADFVNVAGCIVVGETAKQRRTRQFRPPKKTLLAYSIVKADEGICIILRERYVIY